jgi:hypothetical protein
MFGKKKEDLHYQPKDKSLYAYTKERCGDFLLFVEAQKDCYKFLYLPGADPFYLTFEDYTKLVKSNSLEFVDELPDDIFKESLELSKVK